MKKVVLVLFLLATVGSSGAFADLFVLSGNTDLSGQGFGTVMTILSLHDNGTEIGAVAPANATNDLSAFGACSAGSILLCGDAANQSQVITKANLVSLGITGSGTFGLLFNVNQQGSTDGLKTYLYPANPFTVYFYDSDGNVLSSASYEGDANLAFPPLANGQGGSGYLFTLSPGTSFDDNFANIAYLGMSGTISNANDGADNWSIVNATNPNPIPEPATFGLIGAGLVVLGGLFRRRLRNRG